MIFQFLMGLAFCGIYIRTGNLFLAIGFHGKTWGQPKQVDIAESGDYASRCQLGSQQFDSQRGGPWRG
ncbi:MAG: type II CAAX prenyl endopeptidase Rce1 family protein [Planctomyces sp.]